MQENQSGCKNLHKNDKTNSWMPTSNESTCTKNLKYRFQRVNNVRAEAKKNTKCLDEIAVDKCKRRYKTVGYKLDDNVTVRFGYDGKKSILKRRFVVEGKALKKGKHSDNHKVLIILPGQINDSESWVSTEDLTSATKENRTNACDKSYTSKYFIPFTVEITSLKLMVNITSH